MTYFFPFILKLIISNPIGWKNYKDIQSTWNPSRPPMPITSLQLQYIINTSLHCTYMQYIINTSLHCTNMQYIMNILLHWSYVHRQPIRYIINTSLHCSGTKAKLRHHMLYIMKISLHCSLTYRHPIQYIMNKLGVCKFAQAFQKPS